MKRWSGSGFCARSTPRPAPGLKAAASGVLTTPSPDREIILGDIEAGGYFGEMAAIDGQPRSAGILAVTDATIARMPATAFREIFRQFPDVAEQLLLQL